MTQEKSALLRIASIIHQMDKSVAPILYDNEIHMQWIKARYILWNILIKYGYELSINYKLVKK